MRGRTDVAGGRRGRRCGSAGRCPGRRHGQRRPRRHAPCGSSSPGSPPSSGCGPGCGCVALTVARPDRRWRAVTVGPGTPRRGRGRHRRPVDAARARGVLADLVALHREGLREPLPLPDGRRAGLRRARAPAAARRTTRWPRRCAGWCEGRFPASATTRSTPACSAPRGRRREVARRRPAPAASRRGSATSRCGCGARCSTRRCCDDRGDAARRPVAFDVCGDAAHRHHRARGQRRHRQDLHDRRARRPLRRRGPRAASPELLLVTFGRDATPGAARTGPRAAGERRARAAPTRAAARAGDRLGAGAARRRRRTPRSPCAAGGWPLRSPSSTRRRSRPRTSSAGRCSTALGIAGDADPTRCFVEYRGRPGGRGRRRLLRPQVRRDGRRHPRVRPRRGAAAGPRGAVGDPQARLEPGRRRRGAAAGPRTRSRRRCAARSSGASAARGLLTYDDLLTRLHDALADPVPRRGGAAAARYRVVLVDEFQDTDPRAVGASCDARSPGTRTLVLIGDPKQAIYAFRGADVVSLPRGRRQRRRRTPRSPATGAATPALLRALDTVFGGAALGDPRIVVREVESAHPVPRLAGAPVDAAAAAAGARPRRAAPCSGRGLVLVAGARATAGRPRRRGGRRRAARLRRDGRRRGRCGPATSRCSCARTTRRAVHPGRAARPSACPRCCRAPPACSARPRPREWLTLLHALEQPQRRSGSAAAALTCFVGWSVARAGDGADDGDALLDDLGATAARAGPRCCTAAGSPRCSRPSPPAPACPGGCSADADGERRLTDLRHVGQALHAAADGRAARASRRWSSGCATASPRPRADVGPSAAAGSTPTPPRCRSSPCTAARAWSSRSSTCRSRWDRYVPREPDVPLLHDDDGTRACSTSAGGRAALGRRTCARARRPRTRARTCGCSTSR